MPIFELDNEYVFFPPPYLAEDSGLLAIGGDLSTERLLKAYRMGIFPWFNPDEPILWWSPNPRFVLFPENIRITKNMRRALRNNKFQITFDQDFKGVIEACRDIYRPGQRGTWISDEIIDSYQQLFEMGFIHSVEVWQDDELVGGLYGGCLGKCFFGESMFARVSDASKAGFITLVRNLQEHNFELVDCQVYTKHLESMGAEMIPRESFTKTLNKYNKAPLQTQSWQHIFRTDFDY